MTLAPALDRARAAARWLLAHPSLLLAGVAVVLALGMVRSCNRAGQAEDALARAQEEARARAAQVPVVEQVPDVRAELAAVLRRNADLEAELARAQKAVPGAKPVAVVAAATAPAPVAGPARPVDPAQPAPPCLLAAGDLLRLEVDQVVLQGQAGARMLVGTAGARRVSDGSLLLRQPFSAALTEAVAKPAPSPPRWGAGVWVGVGREGWAAGPAVALPPARLGPLQLEAVVGGGLGPSGAWQGGASGVARW